MLTAASRRATGRSRARVAPSSWPRLLRVEVRLAPDGTPCVQGLFVEWGVDLCVHVVGDEAVEVWPRLPLSTSYLLAHAGYDAPPPGDAVLGEVRLSGTICYEIVEYNLSALCIQGTNRSDEIRGNVRRPIVNGGARVQQGGKGQDMGDFAVIYLAEVHAVHVGAHDD